MTENITITDFVESEHANTIYEMALRENFYPEDVFMNVYNFKKICPLILREIKKTSKTKKQRNQQQHIALNKLNEISMENTVHGFVALNETNKIVGYLIYTVFKINPTAHELTFLFVDKEYRDKGIGTMLMEQLLSQIMNMPAIIKVKIQRHENDAFYRKFSFKSADETIEIFPRLKDILPSDSNDFNYMYFTTVKYIQIFNLMSLFIK